MTEARLTLWKRLDARDRDLFLRWMLADVTRPSAARFWRVVTHLGGLEVSIAAVLLPLLFTSGEWHRHAQVALVALVVSHAVVQVIKRSVGRPRPTREVITHAHAAIPDRFSFPSGHACAAMSVATAYGLAVPSLGIPLVLLAYVVGFSRVRLGVHYPGDVIVGQLIGALTSVMWTFGS